jgi:hypothetical protein
MNTPCRISICRCTAFVLALGGAIALTALSAGLVPARADDPPYDQTGGTTETTSAIASDYPQEPLSPVVTEPVLTPEVLTPEVLPATGELTVDDPPPTTTTTSFSSTSTTSTTQASTESSLTTSDSVSHSESSPIVEPSRLEAAPADIDIAKSSPQVEAVPNIVQPSEIDDIKNLLGNPVDLSSAVASTSAVPQAVLADSRVMQWQPDWVSQDDTFRPVIFNPLREPLQVFYLDSGDRRSLTIQPLTSTVIDVARGAYGITLLVLDSVGRLQDVAVGNMYSGPPPESETRIPVVVDYSGVRYKPITVGELTDLGEDPDVGERKVLLDGSTPAWGKWTQNSTGERQFEVHKTQQFPGIDAPAEGPLPGDYKLVAASESLPSTSGLLILVAVLIAALALGALIARVVRSKQRSRHGRQVPRVQTVCVPGTAVAATVREVRRRGEATHAVRLAAHSGPGALTIREVNDDHCRADRP